MPSHDGFVRRTPISCDHNRDLFEPCHECTDDNRRTYSVSQGRRNDLSDVNLVVQRGDGRPFCATLTDMSPIDVHNVTSRLSDAGWSQVRIDVAS